jgi:hypothetical protein
MVFGLLRCIFLLMLRGLLFSALVFIFLAVFVAHCLLLWVADAGGVSAGLSDNTNLMLHRFLVH